MIWRVLKLLLAAVLFWVWLVFAKTYYICEVQQLCEAPKGDMDSTALRQLPKTFRLQAAEDAIISGVPEFYFDYGSTAPFYLKEHQFLLQQISEIMRQQPQTRLKITGVFLETEKVKTPDHYNNLGKARAMVVADKLINEYRLEPTRIMAAAHMSTDTVLKQPIKMELLNYQPKFKDLLATESEKLKEQWNKGISAVVYNGRLAKFDPKSIVFEPVDVFNDYIDSLENYLNEDPKRYLLLIGHSDTQLASEEAKKAGLHYARIIKDYLQQLGFESRIEIESKGKIQPKFEEVLPDGTTAVLAIQGNRRVEFVVKTSD